MRRRQRGRWLGASACAVLVLVLVGWVVGTAEPDAGSAPDRRPTFALSDDAARPGRPARSEPAPAEPVAPAPVEAVLDVAPAPAPVAAPPAGDVAIAPPPARFDARARAAAPPQALRSGPPVQPTGGPWAVVIGVNDYPGDRHDLRSAVNDARDVDEALARFGVPADRRLVVLDRAATADVIRSAADWLAARAAPDATAVFFYAGHVRRVSAATQAMVGADGHLVSDADLGGRLAGMRARAWIAIAACYGGGFQEVLAPGRVLTAAASAENLAYENEGFGRSYMVEYMVRKAMIERGAPESVQSSFEYAKAALDREYPGRAPVQYDHSGGRLELRQPSSTASPAPPPPSKSPPPGGGGGGGGGDTPPPDNGCQRLTLGVVTCKSG